MFGGAGFSASHKNNEGKLEVQEFKAMVQGEGGMDVPQLGIRRIG